jgi:hypothetical protein
MLFIYNGGNNRNEAEMKLFHGIISFQRRVIVTFSRLTVHQTKCKTKLMEEILVFVCPCSQAAYTWIKTIIYLFKRYTLTEIFF